MGVEKQSESVESGYGVAILAMDMSEEDREAYDLMD